MADERTTYTPSEAGFAVGLSKRRILQMAGRGELAAERDERGHWRIPASEVHRLQRERRNRERHEPRPLPGGHEELVAELRAHNATLREQLEAERQAHSEARRLLAAALERIPPQLKAPSPQEPTGGPQSAAEGPEGAEPRSW